MNLNAAPIVAAPLLRGQRVILCVTGSIAAFKACSLARLFVKAGANVVTVLSHSALEFVGAASFAGITSAPVHTSMFSGATGELHVELARQADLIVVAPITADALARLAQGRADDLMTALLLCARCPIVVAPAMHPTMWAHPAVARNVERLSSDHGIHFAGPVDGEVASGDQGMGRMLEPESILSVCKGLLSSQDLAGRRLTITSGPTLEDLDPVRFISNRSSGKMGFALAERAAWRGAAVTLLSGPTRLATPTGVNRIDIRTAEQLRAALWRTGGDDLSKTDALIMAAAVADYRALVQHTVKQQRTAANLTLELAPNPDLLAEVGARRSGPRPVLIGFAVETGSDDEIEQRARQKLQKKRVDLIIANAGQDAFDRDDNRAQFVTENAAARLPFMAKGDLADRILDEVVKLLD